ncbi:hypothetical protein LTS18_011219, partial [Coniosporium uncinatum]
RRPSDASDSTSPQLANLDDPGRMPGILTGAQGVLPSSAPSIEDTTVASPQDISDNIIEAASGLQPATHAHKRRSEVEENMANKKSRLDDPSRVPDMFADS